MCFINILMASSTCLLYSAYDGKFIFSMLDFTNNFEKSSVTHYLDSRGTVILLSYSQSLIMSVTTKEVHVFFISKKQLAECEQFVQFNGQIFNRSNVSRQNESANVCHRVHMLASDEAVDGCGIETICLKMFYNNMHYMFKKNLKSSKVLSFDRNTHIA